MNRTVVLVLLVFAGGLAPGRPAALRAAEPPQRPNVVFIFADDWGWGDLSCHGHPWLKTPNVDRLASQGIDFLQFNVLNPVCSPSRTAATTGHFPARYCIHEHFAPGMDARRNARLARSAGPDARAVSPTRQAIAPAISANGI